MIEHTHEWKLRGGRDICDCGLDRLSGQIAVHPDTTTPMVEVVKIVRPFSAETGKNLELVRKEARRRPEHLRPKERADWYPCTDEAFGQDRRYYEYRTIWSELLP